MDDDTLAKWAALTYRVLKEATREDLAHEFLLLAKFLTERAQQASDPAIGNDLGILAGSLYLAWKDE